MFRRGQLLRQIVVHQVGEGIIELHGVEPSLGDETGRLSLESPDGELTSQEQMTGKGFIIGAEVGQLAAVDAGGQFGAAGQFQGVAQHAKAGHIGQRMHAGQLGQLHARAVEFGRGIDHGDGAVELDR